jgi:DNA repair exonuclease SbcCD ATPase subunit
MLFLASFAVALQSNHSDALDLDKTYDAIQAELTQLRALNARLQHQADSLAAAISELKQKQEISYFERSRLENLLKKSQTLSEIMEQNAAKIERLEEKRQELGTQLIGSCSFKIDSLLSLLQTESGSSKEQLLQRIQSLRQKRSLLERENIPTVAEIPSADRLTVEESDTPEEIEAKRIYYLDQSEKLKQRAALLQEKMTRVRKETNLRRRMADLVEDVRLFDQSDEPYALSSSEAVAARDGTDQQKEYVNSPIGEGREGETVPSRLEFERVLTVNTGALSIYQVDQYIDLLEGEEQKYLAISDSLRRVADQYAQQADKLRQSIDEKLQ